ncbi:hypothetical protein [Raineya sp.]
MKLVYAFLIICFIAIVSLILLCNNLQKNNETLKYKNQELQIELRFYRLKYHDENLQKQIHADTANLRRAVEFFGKFTDTLPR